MLVTFSSPAYGDITMFGDVAIRLLKMMGHSGTVPSALYAEDVQPALVCLEAALEQLPEPKASMKDEEDDNGAPTVSLSHRAMPLLELLRAAVKGKSNVMWDHNK
jgi:hypothetical protein